MALLRLHKCGHRSLVHRSLCRHIHQSARIVFIASSGMDCRSEALRNSRSRNVHIGRQEFDRIPKSLRHSCIRIGIRPTHPVGAQLFLERGKRPMHPERSSGLGQYARQSCAMRRLARSCARATTIVTSSSICARRASRRTSLDAPSSSTIPRKKVVLQCRFLTKALSSGHAIRIVTHLTCVYSCSAAMPFSRP